MEICDLHGHEGNAIRNDLALIEEQNHGENTQGDFCGEKKKKKKRERQQSS